jgi:hypothetical protein
MSCTKCERVLRGLALRFDMLMPKKFSVIVYRQLGSECATQSHLIRSVLFSSCMSVISLTTRWGNVRSSMYLQYLSIESILLEWYFEWLIWRDIMPACSVARQHLELNILLWTSVSIFILHISAVHLLSRISRLTLMIFLMVKGSHRYYR